MSRKLCPLALAEYRTGFLRAFYHVIWITLFVVKFKATQIRYVFINPSTIALQLPKGYYEIHVRSPVSLFITCCLLRLLLYLQLHQPWWPFSLPHWHLRLLPKPLYSAKWSLIFLTVVLLTPVAAAMVLDPYPRTISSPTFWYLAFLSGVLWYAPGGIGKMSNFLKTSKLSSSIRSVIISFLNFFFDIEDMKSSRWNQENSQGYTEDLYTPPVHKW